MKKKNLIICNDYKSRALFFTLNRFCWRAFSLLFTLIKRLFFYYRLIFERVFSFFFSSSGSFILFFCLSHTLSRSIFFYDFEILRNNVLCTFKVLVFRMESNIKEYQMWYQKMIWNLIGFLFDFIFIWTNQKNGSKQNVRTHIFLCVVAIAWFKNKKKEKKKAKFQVKRTLY